MVPTATRSPMARGRALPECGMAVGGDHGTARTGLRLRGLGRASSATARRSSSLTLFAELNRMSRECTNDSHNNPFRIRFVDFEEPINLP